MCSIGREAAAYCTCIPVAGVDTVSAELVVSSADVLGGGWAAVDTGGATPGGMAGGNSPVRKNLKIEHTSKKHELVISFRKKNQKFA